MLLSHILLINLDTRPDRLIHANTEFSKINATYERVKAIENERGYIGCTFSHIRCLELAKARGWPYVFVAEDDITFTDPAMFLENLQKFETLVFSPNGEPLQWDVLVVGGNNCPPYTKINENLIRVHNIQTTTGYIVSQHYYDRLIANMREGLTVLLREPDRKREFAIDIHWKLLQQADHWFFMVPATVVQYADYSNIEGRVVDYGNAMLDVDKRALIERYMRQQQQQQQHHPVRQGSMFSLQR